ncbi:MAG: D-sedoheptulose-7-phosphate isomerase, partial [Desulfuromonadales bacterium]
MKNKIKSYFEAHQATIAGVQSDLLPHIETGVLTLLEAFRGGGKVLIMGNGGSAADAQHLAAEFVGRFLLERKALPAIALTTDTSILTAVGNDYGFAEVFKRQVDALAEPGDVVIGLSTSGYSVNVEKAMQAAREKGCRTIGLLGRDGGRVAALCDVALTVPALSTSHIQEAHLV